MNDDLAIKIASHPKYQELRAKRTGFGWWLTLAMMVVYYGFILLVAFNKSYLTTRVGEYTTLGIPLSMLVIVLLWVLTMIYVFWANNSYDKEVSRLKAQMTEGDA